MHQIQLQRPEKLWMMVREVSLCRSEQLLLGIACELRPALAVGDPPVTIGQAPVRAALLHLFSRPVENVCISDPGFHTRHDPASALSIRFQIVAGRSIR
jgi:hypothetical protein